MGKPLAGSPGLPPGKRSREPDPANPSGKEGDTSAKKLLANNRYAVLENGAEPVVAKKEKVPPFFVKGFPDGLRDELNYFIEKGLKCTIRLCTDGYKIMVPGLNHYKAVKALLLKRKDEFFTHDVESLKPFKVVLRGLHDMEISSLEAELKTVGLKPLAIYKMKRHDTTRIYRDQLYLVNFEKNSTSLSDLQSIKAITHIVVSWEKYRPVHRDVTQCAKCLMFGHGTKNCHITARCEKCGAQHEVKKCPLMESADPVCANCGEAHKATSKSCPKRAEFIAARKRASTNNQPGRKRVPANNTEIPPIAPRYQVPLLQPLPLPNRSPAAATGVLPRSSGQARTFAEATATHNHFTPPGFSGNRGGDPPNKDSTSTLYTTEELVPIFQHLGTSLRSCRTKYDQIYTLGLFLIQYGQ